MPIERIHFWGVGAVPLFYVLAAPQHRRLRGRRLPAGLGLAERAGRPQAARGPGRSGQAARRRALRPPHLQGRPHRRGDAPAHHVGLRRAVRRHRALDGRPLDRPLPHRADLPRLLALHGGLRPDAGGRPACSRWSGATWCGCGASTTSPATCGSWCCWRPRSSPASSWRRPGSQSKRPPGSRSRSGDWCCRTCSALPARPKRSTPTSGGCMR